MVSASGTDATASGGRVVVVGGGIIGCCAAYHLLRSGARHVTLVDANTPGSATTGAGAGFVSHWSAGMIPLGEEGRQLQQYGLDFYRMLSEVGPEIGYRPNGTLIMALTEDGHERFVRPVLESPYAPPEMQDLNAAEIGVKMKGLIDPARVHSGAYNPHGIQLDTTLALRVLVDEIVKLGGIIRSETTVRTILNSGSMVRIETDGDPIEADAAIIAAGAWTNQLLADLGWRLPLLRVLATRIVSDDRGLESTIPTVQCRELRLWLRESFGGVMWGTGRHYQPLYRLDDRELEIGRPQRAEIMQTMADDELAELQAIFPPLRGARIASWAQGVPCYTPDNGLIVGHIPDHPNIVVASGDNESGVTHGPGLGRLSSEIALGQRPFVAPHRFRPDRFARDAYRSEAEIEAALPAWGARKPGTSIFSDAAQ